MAVRLRSIFLLEVKVPRPLCRCLCTKSKRTESYYKERASKLVDKIIRVDHAGEFGADRIYAGQMAVLGHEPHRALHSDCRSEPVRLSEAERSQCNRNEHIALPRV